ncbi:sigma factor-like helix-turn-helix DNA-binding protein, partial [Brachyspira sp.]|uniref:sigma factor-like helix-turn-helix DNA-binding protein n=1 Tax=Brachyspira sp. TaxID=1977261 RepID=UPI00260E31CE
CRQLCKDMLLKLKNKKSNNNIYSDSTFSTFETDLSNIIYTFGLSDIENRDTKRIIIAVLKPEHKKILSLLSKGYTQKEIAKELNLSQSNISQKLNTVKKEIKESLTDIMPYIL